MIEVDASRRSAPRSWIVGAECASFASSILLHAAVFGAVVGATWYWGESLLETTRFAGKQRVVHLQSQWSPDSPPPSADTDTAVQVVIEPTAARIENHHFRQVTAVESVVVLQEVGEPAAPTAEPVKNPERSEQPARETPTDRESPTKPVAKAQPSTTPSIARAAAVPQVMGTEATTPPRFFNNRPPLYPETARQNGWQGTVLLDLKIDIDGQVIAVKIRQSSGFAILDAEAISAVKLWRAEPAKRGGRAVATDEVLPVRFVLR